MLPKREIPAAFRRDRPILGTGRGRMVVLAVAMGSLLPVLLLRHRGDPLVGAHVRAGLAAGETVPWQALAWCGSPLAWLAASVVGFGAASGMNWPNTARWMGMLALGVLWAGLADIAAAGTAAGSATAGMAATTLSLWASRAWPLWAGGAILVLAAQVATGASAASAALVGAVLGALGPLVIEYCWHTVSPGSVPVRGADWRS